MLWEEGIIALVYRIVISSTPIPKHTSVSPPFGGSRELAGIRETNEICYPKGPPNLECTRHVPTEADARSDGEDGEEATETKVQAK